MTITTPLIRYTLLILTIASISLFNSCSGSKSMYKKGLKLEEAGMYNEASNFYYDALKRDIKNVDAAIRLKSVGQIVLSDKLDKFDSNVNNGYTKDAVYEYHYAKQFSDKLKSVNINLPIGAEETSKFNIVKSQYIEDELSKINSLLEEDKFVEAKKEINKLIIIAPKNQEIKDLLGYSTAEPIYRRAMNNYNIGEYKKAYYEFDKIINYKDSRDIKSLAKEKATLIVVIKPISNRSNYYDLDEKLNTKVEELFTNNKNPFLKTIYSESYKRMLSERKSNRDNNWQEHSTNILDADVFLEISISEVDIVNGKLQEYRKRGWEAYKVKKTNKETGKSYYVNSYHKIYYYEYKRKKLVDININYNLKNFNTNDVILNKTQSITESDYVNYINFDGDKNNLRSGYWVSRSEPNTKDIIDQSDAAINKVKLKVSSRRTMQSTNSMENTVVNKLANTIILNVDKYSNSLK